VTSLALLAFLGAGYTHLSKEEFIQENWKVPCVSGDVVKRALKFLMDHQDGEGCVGERRTKYVYHHALAALALCEAYGMTGSDQLKKQSQKAVDFLVAAQNPGKGWRYSSRSGDNDTSVTGWAMMVLKSAELSGLAVPKSAREGGLAWLDEVTDEFGRTGYTVKGTGKVFVPGKNEAFDHHETMAAIRRVAQLSCAGKRMGLSQASALLTRDLPDWSPNKIDAYYWYWGSMALFLTDGPDGKHWKLWNQALHKALLNHQRRASEGCLAGSWDPDVDRWGFEGGRVYTTAINALSLETVYRASHPVQREPGATPEERRGKKMKLNIKNMTVAEALVLLQTESGLEIDCSPALAERLSKVKMDASFESITVKDALQYLGEYVSFEVEETADGFRLRPNRQDPGRK
jgi:hypothetical protein